MKALCSFMWIRLSKPDCTSDTTTAGHRNELEKNWRSRINGLVAPFLLGLVLVSLTLKNIRVLTITVCITFLFSFGGPSQRIGTRAEIPFMRERRMVFLINSSDPMDSGEGAGGGGNNCTTKDSKRKQSSNSQTQAHFLNLLKLWRLQNSAKKEKTNATQRPNGIRNGS